MNKYTTVVLGSIDNEMAEIRRLAEEHGFEIVQATFEGKPIRPGQIADNLAEYDRPECVWIEQFQRPERALDIDHHGDSPYAAFPAARYWEASSLGQFVIKVLGKMDSDFGWERSQELLAIAAADHCMGSAAAGKCPGVDLSPGSYQRNFLYAKARSNFDPTSSEEDFIAACETAAQSLRDNLNEDGGADLRHLPIDGPVTSLGEQYPSKAQFLPIVASLEGIPYIVHIKRKDGKVALRGGGFDGDNPEHREVIEAFLKDPSKLGCLPTDAPQPNNAYGAPSRGFFGGTLAEQF